MRKFFVKRLIVLGLLASFVTWSVPARAFVPPPGIDVDGMDTSVRPGDDFLAMLMADGQKRLKYRLTAHRLARLM